MKKLMTLMIVAVSFLSCSDDGIKTEQDLTKGPKVVGFASKVANVPYFSNQGTVLRKFPMNLIGNGNGQVSSSDIQVSYTVDPTSSAVAGREYSMVDTTGKITIPAGTTFGDFPLNVITGGFSPTVKTELVLNLTTSSPGSIVGAQYSQLRIVFVGCLSQVQGNYNVRITSGASAWNRTDEVVSVIGVNTFRTRYVGGWTVAALGATPPGFEFSDVCGEMAIPANLTLGGYSNAVYGIGAYGAGIDGRVISSTSFEVTKNIAFAAGDATYKYVYTRR
ncbi:hypothetical protein [Flavobacterium sp.]|jgi:hypothetical protein|uniref:hypothetical protein n=1 Tax=Flavobacterium sp. TaxID=239 RepID=UPI0037BF4EA8